jgi:hypothetical protein
MEGFLAKWEFFKPFSMSSQNSVTEPSVTLIDELPQRPAKTYQLNARKITHAVCLSPREAQVMANAMESAGADVFSVTETAGQWLVWCKYRKESTPRHFREIYDEEQEILNRGQRSIKRNGRLQTNWY